MPVTRAQSARPQQRFSPVAVSKPADDDVIILSSDDEQPLKTHSSPPRRKRTRSKNRAPIPDSADIVEISSGEEDTVITRPRLPPHRQPDALAQLQRQLKEAQQEVERLRKDCAAEKSKAPTAAPVNNEMLGELEEIVTCEICTMKMWAPYALPCGHTFCQTCLQDWFGTTQAQHLANYPQDPGLAAALNQLYHALRSPLLPPARRHAMQMQVAHLEAQRPRPKYTCPTCRAQCTSRPTEVFAIKAVVERIAKAQGEDAPQNQPVRPRGGQARLITGPFDGFFPDRTW